jgi:hypothetical protein
VSRIESQQRIQCEPLFFGVAFGNSLDFGIPIFEERPHWRIRVSLGWWGHVTLKVYRVSERRWSAIRKAHGYAQ